MQRGADEASKYENTHRAHRGKESQKRTENVPAIDDFRLLLEAEQFAALVFPVQPQVAPLLEDTRFTES